MGLSQSVLKFKPERSTNKGAIESCAVHIEERGHIFAALSGVDQLSGVGDLLRREFRLAPEFHATATRCTGIAQHKDV